ncbi:hypothetical protein KVV02_002925, partial [Mortierella alpina]
SADPAFNIVVNDTASVLDLTHGISDTLWEGNDIAAQNNGKAHQRPHKHLHVKHPHGVHIHRHRVHRLHGKHWGHHQRHHHRRLPRPILHRHFPRYRHRRLYVRRNLVCRGMVIDRLFCKYRVRIANPLMSAPVGGLKSPVAAFNNGGARVKHIDTVMGEPCSKNPPPRSAAAQKAP